MARSRSITYGEFSSADRTSTFALWSHANTEGTTEKRNCNKTAGYKRLSMDKPTDNVLQHTSLVWARRDFIFFVIFLPYFTDRTSPYQVLCDSKSNIAMFNNFAFYRFSTIWESYFEIIFNIPTGLERLMTFTTPDLEISSSTYVFSGTGVFNVKFGMVSHCRNPNISEVW